MSKKTGSRDTRKGPIQKTFQVKKVTAAAIAVIVLEELSRNYADVCNFAEAVSFAREGNIALALASVDDARLRAERAGAVATPRAVWVFAQASSVMKKCFSPDVDPWPDTKALWFRTERRCERLNRKFDLLLDRLIKGVKPHPWSGTMKRFYEGLRYVLGTEVPVEDVLLMAHYGPGSTTSVRGEDVNFVRKVESNECVPLCVDLAARALVFDKATWVHLGLDPVYAGSESAREGFIRVASEQLRANVTSHDRLMFIFKNMNSLRSIGAQPTCSGMVQLGVHSVGMNLLKKVKIDLADQDWNRKLARKGSLHWDDTDPYCTLDKSNASNMIAAKLVQNFFPPNWAKFLQKTRTPGYEAPPQLGGGLHTYHMYAGMGNGTTFFVETLIFWAATYATQDLPIEEYVQKHEYAVYGDDVILRRSHALRYMRFAAFLGFAFNRSKTFIEGPFRESCGSDYYAGTPVRAAYLQSENGEVQLPELISFHNTLADSRLFPLQRACERLRSLARGNLYPVLPTDPQGNLGFRPTGRGHYDVVKNARGDVLLSEAWQRPRTYMLEVKPKFGDLGTLDPWTQIAVSLLRAKQDKSNTGWSLPIRGLVNYRVIAERDLERDDLKVMLLNQLRRLCVWKDTPWWRDSRGI